MKRYIPLFILLTITITILVTDSTSSLSLESFHQHKTDILTFKESHPAGISILFILLYTFSVALSLPIATLLTLLGGFLFGNIFGTALVATSATLGAVIIFLIAKSSLGTELKEKAGKIYKKVEADITENTVSYLLFLRLVPLFPFFLVNIIPALFNVPLRTYIWTTFFGILPGTFVYVNLGRSLGEIENVNDLISTNTLLAFTLLGIFTLIPRFIKLTKSLKGKNK